MTRFLPIFLLSLFPFCKVKSQADLSDTTLYFGQKPPGLVAEVFAPGIISLKDRYEYGSVFSRNGGEFYYSAIVNKKPQILMHELKNGHWRSPVIILASEKYEYNDPFLSPDQTKLFFISDRPIDGQGDVKDFDIWYIERTKDGWSEPKNAGKEINTIKNEYYMSFTDEGTMYFSTNGDTGQADEKNFDIRYSKLVDNKFTPSQKVSAAINTEYYEADVFVAPDESYLIFCAERPDGMGKGDLFISFKDKNGNWQSSKNMGKRINSEGYEFCPFVSKDGKYLFFSRDGNIFWIDATVIDSLR